MMLCIAAMRDVGSNSSASSRSGASLAVMGLVAIVALTGGCGSGGDLEPGAEAQAHGGSPRSSAEAYAFETVDGGARGSCRGFEARFDERGMQLSNRRWTLSVVVDGLGCPDALAPLSGGSLRTGGQRVERDMGALRAWYLNGPAGLEQGFDVPAAPACAERAGELTIAMSLTGLAAAVDPAGEVALRDAAGRRVLGYRGLYVVDAAQRALRARMRVEGTQLLLDVDVRGATFPIVVDPTWTEATKLIANDGTPNDVFGAVVSIDGDTAVVGADGADGGVPFSGAAYVFVRNAGLWTQQAKLFGSDSAAGDKFGGAVSVFGDTAVVGSYFHDAVGVASGAAHVFVRNGVVWTQQAKLGSPSLAQGDQLGFSVAAGADRVVVGAQFDDAGIGSAYVFERNGTSWTEQAKLQPAGLDANDHFGRAVALDGDSLLVGAFREDAAGTWSGAAYVFVFDGNSWLQQAKLVATDVSAGDEFGAAVALSGDTAVIGSTNEDGAGMDAGAAYVFTRNGSSWSEQGKLTVSDPGSPAPLKLGFSVAVETDLALVATTADDDGGLFSGAVYEFVRSGGQWGLGAKLVASDGQPYARYGWGLALSGGTAIVGALGADGMAQDSGAAYISVTSVAGLGAPCANDVSCGSGFCRDGLCCDEDCGGGASDDCRSCLAAQTGTAGDGTCGTITAQASYVCRSGSGDVCDPDELCDGSAATCPGDVRSTDSTVCREGSGDSCDPQELCPGTPGLSCPADVVQADGMSCTGPEGNGTCQAGACVEAGAGGASSSSSGSGSASGGAEAGSGGGGVSSDGGCGCSTPGPPSPSGAHWFALTLLLMAMSRMARPRSDRGQPAASDGRKF